MSSIKTLNIQVERYLINGNLELNGSDDQYKLVDLTAQFRSYADRAELVELFDSEGVDWTSRLTTFEFECLQHEMNQDYDMDNYEEREYD